MLQPIRTLLSSQCPVCGLADQNSNNPINWCPSCFSLLDSTPRCQQCGLSMPEEVEACGECIANPPPWNKLITLSDYSFPLDGEVRRFKQHGEAWRIKGLTQMLAERIPEPAPLLISVPLHWQRLLSRRFNQSEMLAYHLSRNLGSEWRRDTFKRTRPTPSQRGFTKKERDKNLKGAFILNHKPTHQHVAIVDDVVTTGSTVRHLCDLLLEIGVQRIDIYCLCRTPTPESI